ncbi:hypothetical protein F4777DRAFT_573052 [Nemania sp. FL0916]|nr:hypothetical protein F4777DRAFT_573052 [Nemania sp. FL0916]
MAWISPSEYAKQVTKDGTFVELVYIKPDQPLGMQEWGITAKSGKDPCLCSGKPEVTTDDNGRRCTKSPCSTQISCEDTGKITPRANCSVIDDGALIPEWYDVTIITNNYITDDGDKLKSEEKGCGAMTGWDKHNIKQVSYDGSWTAVNAFTFRLPIFIKAGCVERAIASAGGPKDLQCFNDSATLTLFKRQLTFSGVKRWIKDRILG